MQRKQAYYPFSKLTAFSGAEDITYKRPKGHDKTIDSGRKDRWSQQEREHETEEFPIVTVRNGTHSRAHHGQKGDKKSSRFECNF